MSSHPWRTLAGLPRITWLLAAATLVNRAGTMVMPFLALYLTRALGYPASITSALFVAYGVGAFVGGPLAGRACDRFGAARVLVACLLASGAVLLAFPLARELPAVAASVLVFALTSEGVRPATMTLAGALVPAERRKSAFVVNRLAVNLGMSIGPAIGGFLASTDFRLLFLVDGVTSLAAGALLAVAFRARHAEAEATGVAARAPASRAALSDPIFRAFLLGVVFVGVVFFQLDAAVPLYLVAALGIPERGYGVLCTINTVDDHRARGAAERRDRRLVPRAHADARRAPRRARVRRVRARERRGHRDIMVVLTCGEMMLFPALSAFVADVSPEGRSGEYMGAYSMAFALAFAIGPALGAAVLDRFGGRVLWPGALVASIACAGLPASAARRKARRRGISPRRHGEHGDFDFFLRALRVSVVKSPSLARSHCCSGRSSSGRPCSRSPSRTSRTCRSSSGRPCSRSRSRTSRSCRSSSGRCRCSRSRSRRRRTCRSSSGLLAVGVGAARAAVAAGAAAVAVAVGVGAARAALAARARP